MSTAAPAAAAAAVSTTAAVAASLASAQQAAMPLVREFIDFVNESVTPFHAVATISRMLEGAGYTKVSELDTPDLRVPGGKFFITRNQSSIIALTVGAKYVAGNGLKIVGAHTDSPNIMLRPRTVSRKAGHVGVGVQLYGGGLWHTWFDRDLTVAGRVVVQPAAAGEPLASRLVHLKKAVLRIPNLAIHLADDRESFKPHKENHIAPVCATDAMAKALGQALEEPEGHCGPLMAAIAAAAGCTPSQVVDFDLSIVDTQPAAVTGLYDEFICSPRLDNLVSCFCGVKALIRADASLADDSMIRMVSLFDHEEVGSSTAPGAGGSLMPDLIGRLTSGLDASQRAALIAKSFNLSVDCAHGLHPNYAEKHGPEHRPMLHQGVVIKYNQNQRYATNGSSGGIVLALGRRAGVPLQQFCVKNDSPCGSTIGPILSTLTGINTVDIGNPMWSMHSIRETCGTVDIDYLERLLKAFFESPDVLLRVTESS